MITLSVYSFLIFQVILFSRVFTHLYQSFPASSFSDFSPPFISSLPLPPSDLKSLQKSEGKFGITGGPRGDNLFIWDVELSDFDSKTLLYKDLQSYAHTYKRKVRFSGVHIIFCTCTYVPLWCNYRGVCETVECISNV